jgi:hypothetical protein
MRVTLAAIGALALLAGTAQAQSLRPIVLDPSYEHDRWGTSSSSGIIKTFGPIAAVSMISTMMTHSGAPTRSAYPNGLLTRSSASMASVSRRMRGRAPGSPTMLFARRASCRKIAHTERRTRSGALTQPGLPAAISR